MSPRPMFRMFRFPGIVDRTKKHNRKMRVLNDTLLNCFACLDRNSLDVCLLVSRQFRGVIETFYVVLPLRRIDFICLEQTRDGKRFSVYVQPQDRQMVRTADLDDAFYCFVRAIKSAYVHDATLFFGTFTKFMRPLYWNVLMETVLRARIRSLVLWHVNFTLIEPRNFYGLLDVPALHRVEFRDCTLRREHINDEFLQIAGTKGIACVDVDSSTGDDGHYDVTEIGVFEMLRTTTTGQGSRRLSIQHARFSETFCSQLIESCLKSEQVPDVCLHFRPVDLSCQEGLEPYKPYRSDSDYSVVFSIIRPDRALNLTFYKSSTSHELDDLVLRSIPIQAQEALVDDDST
ncbi:hypothetical protein AAVH_17123 [Aphelenchoides avenae]|nr:hypothetical protein AAVH_17123 [Aphelenchus avenae]